MMPLPRVLRKGPIIVSLMQHRAWLASDSISCKQPSLAIFNKFLASYVNYRNEGFRAKTIVSAGMWPASLQEQAWCGLRDTEFSMIPKVSLDDELLIMGQWGWSGVNKVSQLKKVAWKVVLENDLPKLHAIDYVLPVVLRIDASNIGAGAYLFNVRDDGVEQPILFWSHKFSCAATRWHTITQEVFAIFAGVNA